MLTLFLPKRTRTIWKYDPCVLQRSSGGPCCLRHDQIVHVSGCPEVETRLGLQSKFYRPPKEKKERKDY